MATDGWIKLWRALADNSLWLERPFSKGQAWIDLLLLAQRQDNEGLDRYGNIVKFERGKAYKSIGYLSERWGWSKPRVQRFLENLEKASMIAVESRARYGTTITIANWGKYQDKQTRGDTRHDTRDVTNGVPEALHNIRSKEDIRRKERARETDPLDADGPPPKGTPEYDRWRNQ
jgi:hypothetical protein